MSKKQHVQFSKRMVVFVSLAVTVVTVGALLLCGFYLRSADGTVSLVQSYIGYATICFVAYSGNSAVEKWLIRRYSNITVSVDDEDDNDGGGNG